MKVSHILEWMCRLFLGGLFVVAGYAKIENRFAFEMAIESYQILPVWGVIKVAQILPSLEIALGLLLLSGWKLHWLASFSTALLGFFLVTMAVTYARGVEATCGCFGLGEPVSPRTLVRDTLFFLPSVYLTLIAWRRSKLSRQSAGAEQSLSTAESS